MVKIYRENLCEKFLIDSRVSFITGIWINVDIFVMLVNMKLHCLTFPLFQTRKISQNLFKRVTNSVRIWIKRDGINWHQRYFYMSSYLFFFVKIRNTFFRHWKPSKQTDCVLRLRLRLNNWKQNKTGPLEHWLEQCTPTIAHTHTHLGWRHGRTHTLPLAAVSHTHTHTHANTACIHMHPCFHTSQHQMYLPSKES